VTLSLSLSLSLQYNVITPSRAQGSAKGRGKTKEGGPGFPGGGRVLFHVGTVVKETACSIDKNRRIGIGPPGMHGKWARIERHTAYPPHLLDGGDWRGDIFSSGVCVVWRGVACHVAWEEGINRMGNQSYVYRFQR